MRGTLWNDFLNVYLDTFVFDFTPVTSLVFAESLSALMPVIFSVVTPVA
jgi:hypothetical protein